MDSYIVVQGNGQVIEVTVENDGTVNMETLRCAFLLEHDIPIGLFKNNRAQICRREKNDYLFKLEDDWLGQKFELRWDEARRSRPVKSADQGATKPKRLKLDPDFVQRPVDADLAARVGRYSLYFSNDDGYKRFVIPLTTKLAATFRHGENKSIKKDDEIVVRSSTDENFKVTTHAIKFIEDLDTIILQSDEANLCNTDLIFDSIEPRKGLHYLLMGFSVFHGNTNHQSLSTGIIACDMTRRRRYIGSSGSFKGDSGGSCWNKNGKLIGMQVEVEKVRHTTDDKGRPASPASGGRCYIVAMHSVLEHITDLLPPESDVDSWNE